MHLLRVELFRCFARSRKSSEHAALFLVLPGRAISVLNCVPILLPLAGAGRHTVHVRLALHGWLPGLHRHWLQQVPEAARDA